MSAASRSLPLLAQSRPPPPPPPPDEVPGQEAVCRAVHAFGVGLRSKPPTSGCKLRCSTARSGTHSVLGPWARTRQRRGLAGGGGGGEFFSAGGSPRPGEPESSASTGRRSCAQCQHRKPGSTCRRPY